MQLKPAQLLGVILAAGCVLLLAVEGLIWAGLIGGDIAPPEVSETGGPGAKVDLGDGFNLREEGDYNLIAERPLFQETRQPPIVDPPPEITKPCEETGTCPPVQTELDVSVGAIIITPQVKVAIIKDNKSKNEMRVKEGAPLEEDLSGWTLASIEPRKLIFDGGDAGNAEVELSVHKGALKGGAPPPRAVTQNTSNETSQSDNQPQDNAQLAGGPTEQEIRDRESRAEEIRRRVAERRAQLRAEAERRRQQQQERQKE